jgi:hypothetical protein
MMTKVLQTAALMAALTLPALCQSSQLSPKDQHDFDKAYAKWANDTRRNDRDDISKDARKMEDIMARYNIPRDVPFDRIARQSQYDNQEGRYNNRDAYPQYGQPRLSPEDQRDFDRYYSQWVDDSRRSDRDDSTRDVEHMRDIMGRNNIPPNVPFDQIATPGYRSGPRGGYSGYGQPRLSPDDQREFDKTYAKWMQDSRRNDRDDIEKDARKTQDIMGRYNIPSDVPYDQIASSNAGYRH